MDIISDFGWRIEYNLFKILIYYISNKPNEKCITIHLQYTMY